MQTETLKASPIPELRQAGMDRLARTAEKVQAWMKDDVGRVRLTLFLTVLANQRRGLDCSMKDAGIDVLELICLAHALLDASEQFDPRKKRDVADAKWFRTMARTYLEQAADRFGILAVQRANLMQAEGKRETVN